MTKKNKKILLTVGMDVKIKKHTKDYSFNAGKVKKITEILPDFVSKRAFALDGESGIWCIEDFEYCIGHENETMS